MTNSVVTFAPHHDTIEAKKGGKDEIQRKIENFEKAKKHDAGATCGKLFVTRTAVSKWETDKGLPAIDSLKMIAELFDVTLDELVGDEDIKTKQALDNKRSRTLYYVAIGFLLMTVLFTLLFFFLQNVYFVIGSSLGLFGYITFALLCKPKDRRFSAGKVIVPYVIARIVILAVVVIAIVTTIVRLQ